MNHVDHLFSQWTLFILSPSALAICGIPPSGQKSSHSIGTRRKIDTTREWREQTSISSGLAWNKKRLGDLFGRVWHLECISNPLFFFFFEGREECWALRALRWDDEAQITVSAATSVATSQRRRSDLEPNYKPWGPNVPEKCKQKWLQIAPSLLIP